MEEIKYFYTRLPQCNVGMTAKSKDRRHELLLLMLDEACWQDGVKGLTPFEDCAYQTQWPGCTILTYLLRGSLNGQPLCKSVGVSCRDSDAGWSVAGPAGNQVVALVPAAIFQ